MFFFSIKAGLGNIITAIALSMFCKGPIWRKYSCQMGFTSFSGCFHPILTWIENCRILALLACKSHHLSLLTAYRLKVFKEISVLSYSVLKIRNLWIFCQHEDLILFWKFFFIVEVTYLSIKVSVQTKLLANKKLHFFNEMIKKK